MSWLDCSNCHVGLEDLEDLEYTDELTITKALESRVLF